MIVGKYGVRLKNIIDGTDQTLDHVVKKRPLCQLSRQV